MVSGSEFDVTLRLPAQTGVYRDTVCDAAIVDRGTPMHSWNDLMLATRLVVDNLKRKLAWSEWHAACGGSCASSARTRWTRPSSARRGCAVGLRAV
jgi:hypothetical protein